MPTTGTVASQPQRHSALRLAGVSKTFPGVVALRDVALDVAAGSVHALLGHNGCGKSTLVKLLAGVHHPDPGARAWIDGQELTLGSGEAAAALGLRFVHQDLGIVPELGAADNVGLALGYRRTRLGTIAWRRQTARVRELLARFGVAVDLDRPLAAATPVERTAVAIVRAVAGAEPGRGLLVLDEPTAAFARREVQQLFGLIRDVSATGTAVLLISHRLDEVLEIADRATVMRNGRIVGGGTLRDVTLPQLARWITGEPEREADEVAAAAAQPVAPAGARSARCALRVRGLEGLYLRGVDVSVGAGEIVGVAGLLGSGREELPYAVAGAAGAGVGGAWELDGRPVERIELRELQRRGLAFAPADRARESVFHDFTVRENATLAALSGARRHGLVTPPREGRLARGIVAGVGVGAETLGRSIATLSGGNQQKVVLGRWLAAQPGVLVLAEPTAGVDVGARHQLYELIAARAREGLGVLVASSDVQDLVSLCSRVLVLRDGVVARALEGEEIEERAIVAAMEGVE